MAESDPEGAILTLRRKLQDRTLAKATRADTLIQLAHHCARAGLAREGLTVAKEAIEIGDANGLPGVRASALNAAAMCHYFRGDYLMVVACGMDAYADFECEQRYDMMGHALSTIAAACKDVDARDLAELALQACIKIATRANDPFLKARSYNTLGVMYGDLQRWEEAELALDHALIALSQTVQKEHIPKIIANRGSLRKKRAEQLLAQDNRDAAMAMLQQAMIFVKDGLDAAIEHTNAYEIADKHGALGELYLLMGKHREAMTYLENSQEMACSLKHPQLIAESHFFMGRVYLAQHTPIEAQASFRRGLDCAKQNELKVIQMHINEKMAEACRALGQQQEAELYGAAASEWRQHVASLNREVVREVRALWERRFSHHPMIG
jgi:tetratricopeptide (TPR) repeat protein